MDKIFEFGEKFGIGGLIIGCIAYVVLLYSQYYFNKKSSKNLQVSQKELTTTLIDNINKITNNQNEQNKYLMDNLVKQNENLLTKIINTAYEKREDQHKVSQDYRLKISPIINDMIQNMCLTLHAARVNVIEFCNGAKNTAGLSFMHYKVTYQYHQKGVIPIDMCAKQNINEVIDVVAEINKTTDNAFICDENFFNKIKDKVGVCNFNDNNNVITKLAAVGLYEGDKLRGLLGIEFNDKYLFNEKIFDREYIKNEVGKIETYLFNPLYSEDYYVKNEG